MRESVGGARVGVSLGLGGWKKSAKIISLESSINPQN